MSRKRVEILVVGGGPVGLAMSLDLGMRGISTMMVERRGGAITVPKMGYVNPRTMEFCRRWGVSEQIRQYGWPAHLPRSIFWVTSLTGKKIAGFDYPSYDELGVLPYTTDGGRRCSQLYFDPILLDRLRKEPSVELRHFSQVDSLIDTDDGIEAEIRDLKTGLVETIEAQYAVACDGSDSGLRAVLGVKMLGSAAELHCTNVIFRTKNLWRYLRHGPAAFNWLIGPTGQWGNMISVDGDTLWRLSLTVGDPANPLTPADVAVFIRRAVNADIDFEIQSIMPWTRRDRIAENFRKGRVFLAGDAAHILPPTGGLGMNSGVGDAMDLSWKFAAVLRGWGDPGLLDSYDAERRPIAISNTKEAVENNQKLRRLPTGPEIGADTPAGEELRRNMRHVIETAGYHVEYEQEATVLGYRYRNSPIAIADETQSDTLPATRTNDRDFVQSAVVGGRAPHVWLRDGTSTLDRFWDGFTLVQTHASAADNAPLLQAAARKGVPMKLVDFSFEPGVAEVYRHDFVLVRPDGNIVWQGRTPPTDSAEVAEIIETIRGARVHARIHESVA